jgi:hypothetical protein
VGFGDGREVKEREGCAIIQWCVGKEENAGYALDSKFSNNLKIAI